MGTTRAAAAAGRGASRSIGILSAARSQVKPKASLKGNTRSLLQQALGSSAQQLQVDARNATESNVSSTGTRAQQKEHVAARAREQRPLLQGVLSRTAHALREHFSQQSHVRGAETSSVCDFLRSQTLESRYSAASGVPAASSKIDDHHILADAFVKRHGLSWSVLNGRSAPAVATAAGEPSTRTQVQQPAGLSAHTRDLPPALITEETSVDLDLARFHRQMRTELPKRYMSMSESLGRVRQMRGTPAFQQLRARYKGIVKSLMKPSALQLLDGPLLESNDTQPAILLSLEAPQVYQAPQELLDMIYELAEDRGVPNQTTEPESGRSIQYASGLQDNKEATSVELLTRAAHECSYNDKQQSNDNDQKHLESFLRTRLETRFMISHYLQTVKALQEARGERLETPADEPRDVGAIKREINVRDEVQRIARSIRKMGKTVYGGAYPILFSSSMEASGSSASGRANVQGYSFEDGNLASGAGVSSVHAKRGGNKAMTHGSRLHSDYMSSYGSWSDNGSEERQQHVNDGVHFDVSEIDQDVTISWPPQAFVYCLTEMLKNAHKTSLERAVRELKRIERNRNERDAPRGRRDTSDKGKRFQGNPFAGDMHSVTCDETHGYRDIHSSFAVSRGDSSSTSSTAGTSKFGKVATGGHVHAASHPYAEKSQHISAVAKSRSFHRSSRSHLDFASVVVPDVHVSVENVLPEGDLDPIGGGLEGFGMGSSIPLATSDGSDRSIDSLASTINSDSSTSNSTLETDLAQWRSKLAASLSTRMGDNGEFCALTAKDLRQAVKAEERLRKFGGVRVRVRDTGLGISKDRMHSVFGYFWTSSKGSTSGSKSLELSGYGIGLPMARLYARVFGGELYLTSERGVGTEAVLVLPNVLSQLRASDNLHDHGNEVTGSVASGDRVLHQKFRQAE